jgi:hypothetical protein
VIHEISNYNKQDNKYMAMSVPLKQKRESDECGSDNYIGKIANIQAWIRYTSEHVKGECCETVRGMGMSTVCGVN